MSMYPHERDIFISSTWEMGEHGEFERRTQDTAGMWIAISDECVVEWFHRPEPDEGAEVADG